jgi:hypothetical protein
MLALGTTAHEHECDALNDRPAAERYSLYRDRYLGPSHRMSSCDWFPLSHRDIGAWLDRHPEALPRTLADLARFPIPFRRVMVNAVAAEVRANLWREHLESFLGADSTLSAAQREFVAASLPKLPELLAAPAPNPTIVEWEHDMSKVFSREEAARIFALIGPPEPPGGLPLPPDAVASPAV